MSKDAAMQLAGHRLSGIDLFPLPPKTTIRAIEAYARQDGTVVRMYRSTEGAAYYINWPEHMGDRCAIVMDRTEAYRAFSHYAGVRIIMPAEPAHA